MIEDIEGATSEPVRRWPTQASLCADGRRLNPPYLLMFEATSGRITVTCATSDISVLWETIAR